VDAHCTGAHVIADGGYHGPNCASVIVLYRKSRDGTELPAWKQDLSTVHRRTRARVEHTLVQLKNWNILRNCRRKKRGVWHAALGIALMRNLTMAS
jgi:Transposase DDE domain